MLTNEQLAEFIQQGGNDDLKPILWERVRRLLYGLSAKYFRLYTNYCDEHGVTEWDIKQQSYQAYETALQSFDNDRGKFNTMLTYTFKNSIRSLFRRDVLNTADSLDRKIETDTDGDTAIIDLIADDMSIEPFNRIEDISEQQETARVLRECVDSLEDKEKDVINRYYYDREKLQDIGKAYNVSQQRVIQIRKRALQHLSLMPDIKKLGDQYGYTSHTVYHDSLTGFKRTGQSAVERIAIQRADIELQITKAANTAEMSWLSDKEFIKMVHAARNKLTAEVHND